MDHKNGSTDRVCRGDGGTGDGYWTRGEDTISDGFRGEDGDIGP